MHTLRTLDKSVQSACLAGGGADMLSSLVHCGFVLQVNIVPVIAKADTFATEECERFKKVVSGVEDACAHMCVPIILAYLERVLWLTYTYIRTVKLC